MFVKFSLCFSNNNIFLIAPVEMEQVTISQSSQNTEINDKDCNNTSPKTTLTGIYL